MTPIDVVDRASALLGDPNLTRAEVAQELAVAARHNLSLLDEAVEIANQRVLGPGDPADAVAQILAQVKQQLQN